MLNKIIYVLISVVLVAIFVVLFFTFAPHLTGLFWNTESNTDEEYASYLETETARANALLNQGDVSAALETYDYLLATAPDDSSRQALIFHKANALFMLGKLDTTKEAINILGQAVSKSGDAEFQAWAILSLYRYYYQTQSSEILNHIRSLPLFADILDLDDQVFLSEIVRRSDALYPTMFGKILLASPIVAELEALDTDNSAVAAAKAKEIVVLAEASRVLQMNEKWLTDPYNQMLVFYYRGLILSAATMGGTDPSLAKTDFESALSIAATYSDMRPVRSLAPMVHLHLAYLYLRYPVLDPSGKSFTEEVGHFIDKAVDAKDFSVLVRNAASSPGSRGAVMFTALSNNSATFRWFLESNYSVSF